MIIYAYNDHVWLLSPEPLVVNQPQSTRVEGASIVMKSSGLFLTLEQAFELGLFTQASQIWISSGQVPLAEAGFRCSFQCGQSLFLHLEKTISTGRVINRVRIRRTQCLDFLQFPDRLVPPAQFCVTAGKKNSCTRIF